MGPDSPTYITALASHKKSAVITLIAQDRSFCANGLKENQQLKLYPVINFTSQLKLKLPPY